MICSTAGPRVTSSIAGKIKKKTGKTNFTATLRAASLRLLPHAQAEVMRVRAQSRRQTGSEAVAVDEHLSQPAELDLIISFNQVAERIGTVLAGGDIEQYQGQLHVQIGEWLAQLARGFLEDGVQGLAGFEAEYH